MSGHPPSGQWERLYDIATRRADRHEMALMEVGRSLAVFSPCTNSSGLRSTCRHTPTCEDVLRLAAFVRDALTAKR